MSAKTIQSAREGWFTLDPQRPRLLGTRCEECGSFYFPPHSTYCRNPHCESENFQQVELSHEGRVWSYTDAQYAPPPPYVAAEPYSPFVLAAVALEQEGLIVMGQMSSDTELADMQIGDRVALCLETLFEDEEYQYLVWKWRKLEGAGQ